MWTLKIAVFLAGVISSVLLMINFTFPFSHDFLTTTIPYVWIRVRMFLVPPYLLATVNFIIFVIWILSEHHQSIDGKQKLQRESSVEISSSVVPKNQTQDLFFTETQLQIPSLPQSETKSDLSCVNTDYEVTSPPSVVSPPIIRKQNAVVKRTLNPEPPPPTVEEEEEEKSMDATWDTIMASSPASRQFKRSETWNAPKKLEKVNSPKVIVRGGGTRADMRKSETFNESRRRALILRKDMVVIGKDELNRQVGDFIKKFNDDLRLQRQESHQRYIDMVNRGMTP